MQIIESQDKQTTKYIHNDGSETSFKKSLSGKFSSEDLITPVTQDKNKYSLVISCSKGCQMKCSFCHLTQKNSDFKPLTTAQVTQNLKDVILDQIEKDPSIKNKSIKLCWMGMGEAILKADMIKDVSLNVIDWALENGYASSLDGIDISTVLPKISNKWHSPIEELIYVTSQYPRNFHNAHNRSLVRLFYSLHSANQDLRNEIIPNSKSIDDAIESLKELKEARKIDLVFHYMFMKDVNDDMASVQELIKLYKDKELLDSELRILRYNEATNGVIESSNLKSIIELLEKEIPILKVQHSSGQSVDSACGMFVVPPPLAV